MPASIDAIDAEKQTALDIIDSRLVWAAGQRTLGVPGMAENVAALRELRLSVELQDYDGLMNGAAMATALAALQAATAAMNAAAARMVTATAFVTNVDDLISGAEDAVAALKGDDAAA